MSRVHPNSERELSLVGSLPSRDDAQRQASKLEAKHAATMASVARPSGPPPSLRSIPGLVPQGEDPLKAVFDGLDDHPTAPRSATMSRRAWRLLGKAALLARAMNPRDDVIDIYHDPKRGSSRYMIHPNSKMRRIWDVLTACCVLYVCVVVPLVIGFNYVEWGNRYILDTIVDVYFIVDMFVTMRTGVFSNGEVIMDSRIVMRRYLRTWFIIDIVSNFPLALFVQSSARKSIKMVKLQKLPKLLRIGRLLKYLREYAKYYNLALSFVAMIMALHFFACLWASLFNDCFDADGKAICESSEMPAMYVQSMQNIVIMFLGIAESTGYASISHLAVPHREASIELYIMSIVIFMLGMVITSFFFGNILALIMSWDQMSSQFRNRMDIIRAEMRYYELPEDLQHRVRRNYDYLWINQRAYSDMMLLNQPGISKTLRMTIALHLYKDLVKTVPFFAGSDVRFLGKVCMALETAVYLPGDTIIYFDDIGKEMFIVRKGLVEILIPEPGNPEKRIYLRDGNFFGETALVIDVRRTNTVKAVNICDLNVLSKHSFNEIVAEYPEFGERMKRTVIKRQLDNMNIQSPTEKIKIQNQLNMVVEKSLKARRMSVSLRTIYRAKKLGDKLKEIADRAAKSNQARRMSRKVSRLVPATAANGVAPSPGAHLLRAHSGAAPRPRPIAQSVGAASDHTLDTSFTGASAARAHSKSEANHSSRSVGPPGPGPPPPHSNGTHYQLTQQNLPRQSSQLDAVSRKLSASELPSDLLPAALLEITNMVNEIKRTTERLSRRLQHNNAEYSSEDDFDLDDDGDDEQYESGINVGLESEATAGPIPPLVEEDEEVVRRDTRSIFIPDPNRTHSMRAAAPTSDTTSTVQ